MLDFSPKHFGGGGRLEEWRRRQVAQPRTRQNSPDGTNGQPPKGLWTVDRLQDAPYRLLAFLVVFPTILNFFSLPFVMAMAFRFDHGGRRCEIFRYPIVHRDDRLYFSFRSSAEIID